MRLIKTIQAVRFADIYGKLNDIWDEMGRDFDEILSIEVLKTDEEYQYLVIIYTR
jgi:hypothetical protein